MPTRILRDGILSSPRINQLSLGAEVLYRRLMSVADDYGRFYASTATIRGACWPTSLHPPCEQDVDKWLTECQQGVRPLLTTYEHTGCWFIQISDFNQKTRSKSKFPEPVRNLSTTCPQVADKVPALDVVGDGDGDGDGDVNTNAPDGALLVRNSPDEITSPDQSVVRPAVRPPKASRKAHRTTEEIRSSLGNRLSWWENFWKEYPCHEGMNAAMDAFERRIHTRDEAVSAFHGAKAYAARLRSDTSLRPKWGQGWINEERWLDENRLVPQVANGRQSTEELAASIEAFRRTR